jgi:hypothetical protein
MIIALDQVWDDVIIVYNLPSFSKDLTNLVYIASEIM